MTVKELITKLLDCPLDSNVSLIGREIHVKSDKEAHYDFDLNSIVVKDIPAIDTENMCKTTVKETCIEFDDWRND